MPQRLSLFSETDFEHRAIEGFPISCPTLDLSASWDGASKNLLVYRPRSQAVSKIHQVGPPGSKAPEVVTATWKADGQFLAVGWTDGAVRLVGQESNKASHHIDVCTTAGSRITHIGWACSDITKPSASSLSSRLKTELGDEWKGLDGNNNPGELPRQITFLDIESALPKISPLPSASAGAGEDATVFTQRTSIEYLFQALKPEDYDRVNVMVVGTSDSKLQLSIYDSFVIGSFRCPSWDTSVSSQLMGHTSHPRVPTHSLLVAEKSKDPEEVHLVPMDLPFLSSFPINLSLLASKLTTLQKLLRYLKQTQLHMQLEWKNTRELPNRFLRSVQGDLEGADTGPRSIVAALYHTVVTGHAHEPVGEWLVDSLAERGHKRWDKAVVSGLENLRSLVHENFLPALERCIVILSRLRGLARFYDSREDIGFSVTNLTKVMDIVTCLTVVGNKILVSVMDELEHFNSFSTWLRFQIDRLAASAEAEELTEKEATMDIGKVLVYIERYLMDGSLKVYFGEASKEEHASDLARADDGINLLELLTTQLKKHESGQEAMKALPRVEFLVDFATTTSEKIFKDIAEAQKRSVRFGQSVQLSTGQPIKTFDSRMCQLGEKGAVIHVALSCKDTSNQIHLHRIELEIINGISSNRSIASCTVDLGENKLLEAKFLGDYSLILLCSSHDNATIIIRVPIQSDQLIFKPRDQVPNTTPKVSTESFPIYYLPENINMKPMRMEVHEKRDLRGETPARICLLGADKSILRVFTFPE